MAWPHGAFLRQRSSFGLGRSFLFGAEPLAVPSGPEERVEAGVGRNGKPFSSTEAEGSERAHGDDFFRSVPGCAYISVGLSRRPSYTIVARNRPGMVAVSMPNRLRSCG